MFAGLDVSKVHEISATKDQLVTDKLLVKGIVTGQDAALAVEHGVDGLVVSNHGGRDEETLRSTINHRLSSRDRRCNRSVDGRIRSETEKTADLDAGNPVDC